MFARDSIVSRDIRHMRIFAIGFSGEEAPINGGLVESANFQALVAVYLQNLNISY